MSRPFDVRRDGFVMRRGSGRAGPRGPRSRPTPGRAHLRRDAGAASTADAYPHHRTRPRRHGAAACMELALEDAWIEPGQVGPHQRARHLDPAQRPGRGPGHREGVRIPVPAGHLGQGGHGARPRWGWRRRGRRRHARHRARGCIPPTAGHEQPDPQIELDIVHGEARAWDPAPALSNSFGFGGHNGCLVLGPPSPTDARPPRSPGDPVTVARRRIRYGRHVTIPEADRAVDGRSPRTSPSARSPHIPPGSSTSTTSPGAPASTGCGPGPAPKPPA